MTTKLIELEDSTLIEIEVAKGEARPIAGGFAEKVSSTFARIQPILIKTCRPIIAAWHELNQEMLIEKAEIELGLSFEGEGNIYVTKTKAGANLTVKLSLKPKPSD